MAKGRTWVISFEDDAKKDGDVKVKWKVKDASGAPRELPGTWEGYREGDTPEKKATRFFDRLNSPPYNQLVNVTRAGNNVAFQLKDNAPYSDINGVEIGDQTGQNFDVYDDPNISDSDGDSYLEVCRFRLHGTPQSEGAEARLGLGHTSPLARVSTFNGTTPRSVNEIISMLTTEFNSIYAADGFQAESNDDEVIIPDVPCKLAFRGGCNDTGLEYWLSMSDAEAGPFESGFDKFDSLNTAIRQLNARLDLAGIADVAFADEGLHRFTQIHSPSQVGKEITEP